MHHPIFEKQKFSIGQIVFLVLFLILEKVLFCWLKLQPIKKDLSVCFFATWQQSKKFWGRSKNELKCNYENIWKFPSNLGKFQTLTFPYVLFHLISNFQPYLMQLNLVYIATYILRFVWLEKVICLNAAFKIYAIVKLSVSGNSLIITGFSQKRFFIKYLLKSRLS